MKGVYIFLNLSGILILGTCVYHHYLKSPTTLECRTQVMQHFEIREHDLKDPLVDIGLFAICKDFNNDAKEVIMALELNYVRDKK